MIIARRPGTRKEMILSSLVAIMAIAASEVHAGTGFDTASTRLGSRYVGNTAELDIFETPVSPLDAPDVNGLHDVP